MEVTDLGRKVVWFWKQYKFVALIALVGIILLCIPNGRADKTTTTETQAVGNALTTAQELEMLLSKVHGAGEVKVLLSIAEGERIEYQTDTDTDLAENSSSIRVETVIVSDGDRNEGGLIKQTFGPVYLGAVIVCEGADQPSVKLAIVEAVCKVTGLGADKICVLKMK